MQRAAHSSGLAPIAARGSAMKLPGTNQESERYAGRAIPRANVDRLRATASYAERLFALLKCLVSPAERHPATPGR
jgi:hypothetical protein